MPPVAYMTLRMLKPSITLPEIDMKDVTIVAVETAVASTFTGPMDVFSLSGVLWNGINSLNPSPYFTVRIATKDGDPVKCLNGITLTPHCSIHDIPKTDLVLVSAISGSISQALDANKDVVTWLKAMHGKGAWLASVCTGAFLLAETGLLDGRTATTHWGFIRQFRKRYPKVICRPDALITDEGDLFCSGGSNSCIDLSLYLVEKLCSRAVAIQSAKSMVYDLGRSSQAPYAVLVAKRTHRDSRIHDVQNWIEENYNQKLSIPVLARKANMSERTFQRRFKDATGDTPTAFLQKVRIEAARDLLETGYRTFEEATYLVGYEDPVSFRKIFLRQTGLLPRDYQRLYRKKEQR
jgi:transcriptional regulator GlxA family with amidase domain